MMRALTLLQPWAWALVAGHKPVENRPWAPPANMIGVPFAIHAGKRWDSGGARTILDLLQVNQFPDDDPLVRASGSVIGIATIEGVVASASRGTRPSLSYDQRRWFSGPVGWLVRDVVRLAEPVPCRGFQRFWTLASDVEAEVRRQVGGHHEACRVGSRARRMRR